MGSLLKEEALAWTMWSAGFGRGFGPVVRQKTKRMNIYTRSVNIMYTQFDERKLYVV